MDKNHGIFANTVSSKGQLKDTEFVSFSLSENATDRVLFVGNSITRHGVAENIGWPRDCGMAASSIENDYVHAVVRELKKKYGSVSFCIAQAAEWERNYQKDADILAEYQSAVDFKPNIVIIRIGENTNRDNLNTAEYAKHFEYMVKYFSQNAEKIIVTSLFWAYAPIDEAIKTVCERNSDYIYVSISELGEKTECKAIGEYAHSGVAEHPGDFGMMKIAEAILTAIGE